MKIILLIVFNLLIYTNFFAQTSQFRIRQDEYLMIGAETYKVLTFGQGTSTPNNGQYAIEYWPSQGGLNFWKPWPSNNPANAILFLRDDHRIGVGTTGDVNYRLDINGRLRAVSGFWTGSDQTIKKDIKPYNNGLNVLMQIKPVSYRYKQSLQRYSSENWESETDSKQKTIKAESSVQVDDRDQLGFIAQELEKVLPEAVMKDSKGIYSINYDILIPVLVNAFQVQQQEIEVLKAKIEKIEKN